MNQDETLKNLESILTESTEKRKIAAQVSLDLADGELKKEITNILIDISAKQNQIYQDVKLAIEDFYKKINKYIGANSSEFSSEFWSQFITTDDRKSKLKEVREKIDFFNRVGNLLGFDGKKNSELAQNTLRALGEAEKQVNDLDKQVNEILNEKDKLNNDLGKSVIKKGAQNISSVMRNINSELTPLYLNIANDLTQRINRINGINSLAQGWNYKAITEARSELKGIERDINKRLQKESQEKYAILKISDIKMQKKRSRRRWLAAGLTGLAVLGSSLFAANQYSEKAVEYKKELTRLEKYIGEENISITKKLEIADRFFNDEDVRILLRIPQDYKWSNGVDDFLQGVNLLGRTFDRLSDEKLALVSQSREASQRISDLQRQISELETKLVSYNTANDFFEDPEIRRLLEIPDDYNWEDGSAGFKQAITNLGGILDGLNDEKSVLVSQSHEASQRISDLQNKISKLERKLNEYDPIKEVESLKTITEPDGAVTKIITYIDGRSLTELASDHPALTSSNKEKILVGDNFIYVSQHSPAQLIINGEVVDQADEISNLTYINDTIFYVKQDNEGIKLIRTDLNGEKSVVTGYPDITDLVSFRYFKNSSEEGVIFVGRERDQEDIKIVKAFFKNGSYDSKTFNFFPIHGSDEFLDYLLLPEGEIIFLSKTGQDYYWSVPSSMSNDKYEWKTPERLDTDLFDDYDSVRQPMLYKEGLMFIAKKGDEEFVATTDGWKSAHADRILFFRKYGERLKYALHGFKEKIKVSFTDVKKGMVIKDNQGKEYSLTYGIKPEPDILGIFAGDIPVVTFSKPAEPYFVIAGDIINYFYQGEEGRVIGVSQPIEDFLNNAKELGVEGADPEHNENPSLDKLLTHLSIAENQFKRIELSEIVSQRERYDEYIRRRNEEYFERRDRDLFKDAFFLEMGFFSSGSNRIRFNDNNSPVHKRIHIEERHLGDIKLHFLKNKTLSPYVKALIFRDLKISRNDWENIGRENDWKTIDDIQGRRTIEYKMKTDPVIYGLSLKIFDELTREVEGRHRHISKTEFRLNLEYRAIKDFKLRDRNNHQPLINGGDGGLVFAGLNWNNILFKARTHDTIMYDTDCASSSYVSYYPGIATSIEAGYIEGVMDWKNHDKDSRIRGVYFGINLFSLVVPKRVLLVSKQ